MRLTFCVLCGQNDPATLEHHHYIPKVLGGSDDETNMFTVCGLCHGKIHNIPRPLNLSDLIKEGVALQEAKTASQYISIAAQKFQEAEAARKKADDIMKETHIKQQRKPQKEITTCLPPLPIPPSPRASPLDINSIKSWVNNNERKLAIKEAIETEFEETIETEFGLPNLSHFFGHAIKWKGNDLVSIADNNKEYVLASIVPDKEHSFLFHIITQGYIIKCDLNLSRIKPTCLWLVDQLKKKKRVINPSKNKN